MFEETENNEERIKKEQEIKEKYELENLSEYGEIVDYIVEKMAKAEIKEFKDNFSSNGYDAGKMNYLSTLVNQNWLIIKKLDEISKKLDK